VLTHGNYRQVVTMLESAGAVQDDELTYLFLPLAHAYALLIQLVNFDIGTTIAYFGGDSTQIVPEVQEVSPTYLPSVPRIFEKIYTLALADREDLRHLGGVLADHGDRLGVAGHPLAFLGRVGGVDRDHHRAGAGDGEVAVRPFRARVAQQRHALARRDAEIDEAQTDLAHDLADLGEGHVAPLAVDLAADRGAI